MSGALRSTLLPAIGPAVAQLPALSQTWRLSVDAFASSLPAGTLVDSEKLASAGFARPEPLSFAVQGMLTLLACQLPSGEPQVIVGGVVSLVESARLWKPPPAMALKVTPDGMLTATGVGLQ